jgi:hypothetical protein
MSADLEKLLAKARKTNARRDASDRKRGFAAPEDCPPFVFFKTAMSAIETGISASDWDCVAEGYVMLEAFLNRFYVMSASVDPVTHVVSVDLAEARRQPPPQNMDN